MMAPRTGVEIHSTWTVKCYDCGRDLGTYARNQYEEAQEAVSQHKGLPPINGGCIGHRDPEAAHADYATRLAAQEATPRELPGDPTATSNLPPLPPLPAEQSTHVPASDSDG